MPGPCADAKGVLLDVGGVLLPTPWELLEDFEARNGWPPGTLPWRGPLDPAADRLWRAVQAGELTSRAYFDRRAAEISRLLGQRRSWPELTRAIFETPAGLAVRPEAPDLVAAARAAGLRTGLLTSKLVAFLSREVVARSDFLSSFDVLLDESETGVAKPDPRAYEQAAAAMGLDPAGIVFVDDDPANVAGADAAGMIGVHFDVTDPAGSFARVRDQLRLRRSRRVDPETLADEIDRWIRALPAASTGPVRQVRREYSRRLRPAPASQVLAVALALVDRQRWVAYELLLHHPGGLACLGAEEVERLGQGMGSWGEVDAFGSLLAGPAWRLGRVPDALVQGWAASPDRWWRRAALVATVPLNLRSGGGTGDTERTLDICRRLAADRDDMVVKALSWALRALVPWDPAAVRQFLDDHDQVLAARVRREVTTKLATGRKRA